MKRIDWVTYRNKRSTVALVGKPPRGMPRIDVVALTYLRKDKRGRVQRENTIYMTPDEAADHVRLLASAIAFVTRHKRRVFARRPR